MAATKMFKHFDFEKNPSEPDNLGLEAAAASMVGRHCTGDFQLYEMISSTHDGHNLVFYPRDSTPR